MVCDIFQTFKQTGHDKHICHWRWKYPCSLCVVWPADPFIVRVILFQGQTPATLTAAQLDRWPSKGYAWPPLFVRSQREQGVKSCAHLPYCKSAVIIKLPEVFNIFENLFFFVNIVCCLKPQDNSDRKKCDGNIVHIK